jgi:hypothetical protein
MKYTTLIIAFLASALAAGAATITEDFSTDPALDGWQVFGNTNLFHWNSTNENLEVTWDSLQTNSYFYHPLGALLSDADGFTVDFDLLLTDSTATSNGFEVAIGFFNLADATNANFSRSGVTNSANLAEFDYFPPTTDTGYGPSIDASVTDTNSFFGFNYDFTVGLDDSVLYHVTLNHAPGDRLVTAVVSVGGNTYTTLPYTYIEPGLSDFRVDTISISSYDGYGPSGTVLAHGTVDNLVVTTSPNPIWNVTGVFAGGAWQATFFSRTNYNYTLERSTDLGGWSAASDTVPGNNDAMSLTDMSPPAAQAFYRIRVDPHQVLTSVEQAGGGPFFGMRIDPN